MTNPIYTKDSTRGTITLYVVTRGGRSIGVVYECLDGITARCGESGYLPGVFGSLESAAEAVARKWSTLTGMVNAVIRIASQHT